MSTIIFTFIVGVTFLIVDWVAKGSFPLDNIIGLAIGMIVIGLIVVLTGGMGEGDIEIALVAGLFLGIKGTIFMLFTSIIIGGIVAMILLLTKRKKGKSEMAFGPYLGIAAIISAFCGNQIINIYLNSINM